MSSMIRDFYFFALGVCSLWLLNYLLDFPQADVNDAAIIIVSAFAIFGFNRWVNNKFLKTLQL